MPALVKAVLALALLGSAIAEGSASTASNTFAPGATAPHTSYATTTVNRAAGAPTLGQLAYTLDGLGTSITSVTVVLIQATPLTAASISFNGGATFACVGGTIAGPKTRSCTCTPAAPQPTKGLTNTTVTIK